MNSQRDTTKLANKGLAVWISLGSNLDSAEGSPAETLAAVIARLANWESCSFAASSLYRSNPEDCPPGTPDFVNAAVRLELPSEVDSEELLDRMQALEIDFGRQREGVINESRTLDLDIIAIGDRQECSSRLILPHPRAHLRRFVLQPVAELDPGYVLPGQSLNVSELLRTLPPGQVCEPVTAA